MSHSILDDKTDKKLIDSCTPATKVDISTISIGAQIYYLYKEEDDDTILSWYWGCVIEIDKTRANGEYYHVWHDDEDPWIDLSKDLKDWKQIPSKHELYDHKFDISQYILIQNTKNPQTQTKKSKSKKSRKRRKSNKPKKEKKTSQKSKANKHKPSKSVTNMPNKLNSQIPKPKRKSAYECVSQGIAIINPKITSWSCTITEGPKQCTAVQLQCTNTANPYTFWVRKQDITQCNTKEPLHGQRVAFAVRGKSNRYKILNAGVTKEFIQCYWGSQFEDKTWININNFHTTLVDRDSDTNSKRSNKENEQTHRKRKRGRRNDTDTSDTSPSVSVPTNPKPKSSKKQRNNSYSTPMDRIHQKKPNKRLTNTNNAVTEVHARHSSQQYQQLQSRFYSNTHIPTQTRTNAYNISPFTNTISRSTSLSNSMPQTHTRIYCNGNGSTPQSRFLHSPSNNAFTSPLHTHTHNKHNYRYQIPSVQTTQLRIGQKRARPRSNSDTSLQPSLKRQRVNANGSTDSFHLIAPQPPQPQLQMPALQASATPKAPVKMPSPDGVSNQKRRDSFADDVSSIDSGVGSESDKGGTVTEIGINVSVDSEMKDVSDESQDTIVSPEMGREGDGRSMGIKNHFLPETVGYNRARHVLSEPPPVRHKKKEYEFGMCVGGSGKMDIDLGMNCVYFPTVSIERISENIMDQSLSHKDRVHNLKCMLKYMINCETTMTEMSGRFLKQSKKVIQCLQNILQDLEGNIV